MDAKEKQLLDFYYNKFIESSFDEKDVYGFLNLVKEDAVEIQVIKELGDFIVHRGKREGTVKTYLEASEEILNQLGKGNQIKKIEDVFSFKEIRNGFNTLFQKYGFNKLSSEIINDLVLCIISLFQGVKFGTSKPKKDVGYLSFAASSKEVFLMGNIEVLRQGRYMPVSFQVLSAKNTYEKITPQDKNDTPYLFLEEVMEVINIDGALLITFPGIN